MSQENKKKNAVHTVRLSQNNDDQFDEINWFCSTSTGRLLNSVAIYRRQVAATAARKRVVWLK
jgi:hypothetical protein